MAVKPSKKKAGTPKAKQEYGDQSITSLKGADRVRLRPGVIFGSDGLEGCEHTVFEIISNAIDEARAGFGKKIIITRFNDNSIQIQDFARGLPVDYNNNEKRYNWELLFCELYAGGKYGDDSGYKYSLGLNGLGLCATQYASEYMDAEIFNGTYKYNLHFEKGENIGGLQKIEFPTKKTGSTFRWRPDLDVFTDIAVSLEHYQDMIKRQAVVNAGITFELNFQNDEDNLFQKFEYYYENGIIDHLEEIVGDDIIMPATYWESERIGRDQADRPDYKVVMQVAVCFSNRVKCLEYYHNSSWLEYGGSPEKAVKAAFVSQIDAYLKQSGKYLKNESKITFSDVEECLCLISSSFSTQTSYENQTKKAINNKFIVTAMTDFLKHQLEICFLENPNWAVKISDQILINKRSRENAEKTRQGLKKKLAGSMDITNRVQKFVDCRTKDRDLREIYIVEGDSALGSCKLARDSEFQAIIPVRGKILNCLKSGYDKIFKNDIISDIIKVLGCGVEVKSKANKDLSSFDLSLLRWNKIIICTDADVDGFQIRTLILTMLYCLVPTLIEQGFVYIAESPLYEITTKDDTFFAYTEKEKSDIMEKLEGKKTTIQRSKGLGENEPEMMWLTTMNPKTRRLIRVMPEDDPENASKMFDVFLGNNLDGRKDFIAEFGSKYIDLTNLE